jgi:hypothetical protein
MNVQMYFRKLIIAIISYEKIIRGIESESSSMKNIFWKKKSNFPYNIVLRASPIRVSKRVS